MSQNCTCFFKEEVYIIDYGLAKKYKDLQTHKHIPYRSREENQWRMMIKTTLWVNNALYCSLCSWGYSYLKRLFRDLFIREGYQFDYVFDWTILKYPQLGASSRSKVPAGKTGVHSGVGPTIERANKHSGKEVREKYTKVVEPFSRRNSSGGYGESSKQKSAEVVTSSKDTPNSIRGNHTSTRPSSTSRRVVASTNKSCSSNGTSERSNRLVSRSGRLSTSQRLKFGSEPSRLGTPSRPPTSNKGGLDDAVRSIEWWSIWLFLLLPNLIELLSLY